MDKYNIIDLNRESINWLEEASICRFQLVIWKMLLTCLSYLSHFGAILGMASFTCCWRDLTVDGSTYGPSFMVFSKSASTLSWRLTVFSEFKKISYKKCIKYGGRIAGPVDGKWVLTADGSILDTKQLVLVVVLDGWVGISVSWQEWKLVWQVFRRHFRW